MMKKKREDERENEDPPNPPDGLAQHVSKKKKLSDELFLMFPSTVQSLTVFSIIYMIRIRFSGRGK